MDDQQRLQAFVARLAALDGLDAGKFERLVQELDRAKAPTGYDEQGQYRIAFFDARTYDLRAFEDANPGGFSLHPVRAALDEGSAPSAEGCKAACIFVNDRCDARVAQVLADVGVELIALRCAGYNNVDVSACQSLGIEVVRVPAYSPHAVAEHAVALMLLLNRRLHIAYLRNRGGSFLLDGLTGFDMHGKTVGVVGAGRIGRCVIEIMRGFGCRVLAFDANPPASLADGESVAFTSLDRLLAESDIVTLHVPLLPETHHLIDAAAIDRMRQGVMLINTSRGGLVDARALIDGLKSGKIGSAGLDVYEEESGVFFHDLSDRVLTDDVLARLMTFNNVVITSHQAFLTREALANIAATTYANIQEFLAGKRGVELTNGVAAE